MKRILSISFWIIIAIYLLVVFGFIITKNHQEVCTSVQVYVQDTLEHQFISDSDVLELLESGGTKVINEPMNKLNIALLERKINKIPYVKHAEVYKKINGQLVVKLEQRVPVVRIINKNDKNYYLDQEGFMMPVSKKVPARLLVANGSIDYTPNFDTSECIYNKIYDKSKKMKLLRDIHQLAIFINADEFWKAQIQQIYIEGNRDIDLVPLVSDQIIILGTIDNLDEKFRNLEAVYKKGFSIKGWNSYKEINLKYKNQVVCVKS